MFAYCLNNPVNMTDESGTVCTRTSNIMMTDGGDKNNEYWDVYMRNYTIIGSTKVPFLGKPNSYYKSPDGRVERWYGADGRPIKDKHNDNHGNPKTHPVVPHFHDWKENENGEWKPGKWYGDYSYLDENVRIPIIILPYPGFDVSTTVGISAFPYHGFDASTTVGISALPYPGFGAATTAGIPAFSYGFTANPWLQMCK